MKKKGPTRGKSEEKGASKGKNEVSRVFET